MVRCSSPRRRTQCPKPNSSFLPSQTCSLLCLHCVGDNNPILPVPLAKILGVITPLHIWDYCNDLPLVLLLSTGYSPTARSPPGSLPHLVRSLCTCHLPRGSWFCHRATAHLLACFPCGNYREQTYPVFRLFPCFSSASLLKNRSSIKTGICLFRGCTQIPDQWLTSKGSAGTCCWKHRTAVTTIRRQCACCLSSS